MLNMVAMFGILKLPQTRKAMLTGKEICYNNYMVDEILVNMM